MISVASLSSTFLIFLANSSTGLAREQLGQSSDSFCPAKYSRVSRAGTPYILWWGDGGGGVIA